MRRVHPDFLCIAIGTPVPKYPGNLLDPPLRSRFSAYSVPMPDIGARLVVMHEATPTLALPTMQSVVAVAEAVQLMGVEEAGGEAAQAAGAPQLPRFPPCGAHSMAQLMATFPLMRPALVMNRVYVTAPPPLPLPLLLLLFLRVLRPRAAGCCSCHYSSARPATTTNSLTSPL